MAESKQQTPGGLIAIIGDEDTVTGFLLAGVGHRDAKGQNFLVVDPAKTKIDAIEKAFRDFTARADISIILINQTIAEEIRYLIKAYDKVIPTILEIPSKDAQYDESKDEVLQRVQKLLGRD
mmetsp:Transcript_4984/g.10998  ORF Transcript_4984/g.10998 Transcript_4984/m.10998 type:complete len:122 (-) Transcript_4984:92-457(-)